LSKYFYILIIALLFNSIANAQVSFNNEWINYDQQYFKILVSEDGIYRIPYTQLIEAGIPVDQINPRQIQLFYLGEEQHIHIKGESGGIFDPNGYIEFYGMRNRGVIDTAVYQNHSDLINPDYSMFNDTSVYFLTWSNSFNNNRISVSNNIDFNSWIANTPNYCLRTIRKNYTARYVAGSSRNIYGDGEGWFDSQTIMKDHPIYGTQNVTKTISTPNVYSQGTDVEVECAIVGYASSAPDNYYPHNIKVTFLGNDYINETYSGYEHIIANVSFNANILGNSLSMVFSSNDNSQTSIPDQSVISYIQIKYPHSLDFDNSESFKFSVKPGSGGMQLLQFSNFNTDNAEDIVLYDLTDNYRIKVVNEGGVFKALLPESGSERNYYLAASEAVKEIEDIRKVSANNKFVNYLNEYQGANYLLVTHNSLMNSAQQYAYYRNSTGFNVAVADVNQLYCQYAFGVEKHPMSISKFAEHYWRQGGTKPQYLFLFGKSLHARDYRNNSQLFEVCLVPSFGNPSSDNLFTIGIVRNDFRPELATGRLAAKNNEEGIYYLNKIIAYESATPDEWMKNIMHFGGGANAYEQQTFAQYLSNYENIIEDTLFGAYVSTFLKTSSEPIQITQSDSITNLINNGVSIMTFFGHASATGFDQSIDDPINYQNVGKYPFILANSCYAGDIHIGSSTSTSEDWVLIPDKGSVGFLASVGEGIPSYLNIFSTSLYKKISSEFYGASIGIQFLATVDEIQENNLNNTRMEITCHEFLLHGDPALKLNAFEKPDLTVKLSDIKFVPNEISTVIDSFDVEIIVTNLGKATSQAFLLSVSRDLPDEQIEEYSKVLNGCNYKDTISFKMPVDKVNGPGINTLHVFVDSYDVIDESNELNNKTDINFLIRSADLFPVYPYEYSIYPASNVRLIASTGDPFSPEARYVFQIDTTDMFDSMGGEAIAQTIISQSGGIISWDVPFELIPETVYYWRIAIEHQVPDSMIWKESSFIYISGEEGWSQAHFYQFKNSNYRFINQNREEEDFNFEEVSKTLQAYNHRYVSSATYSDVRYTMDGAVNNGLGDYGCCGNQSAIMVAIIDPVRLLAWSSSKQDYGHRNYPRCYSSDRDNYYYVFSSGYTQGGVNYIYEESMQNMINLVESVPEGHYILMYTWGNPYFEQWDDSWLDYFESLGAFYIRELTNDQAYIFFVRKGSSDFFNEVYSVSEDNIELPPTILTTDFIYGNIQSTLIGPSNAWESLHWFQNADDNIPQNDSVILSVFGVRPDGSENLLIDNIEPGNYEIYNLENEINSQEYPYLKLNFFTQDDSTRTPAQLKKWQLRHQLVPETAISTLDAYRFCCDTIQEGDSVYFAVATKNVSPKDMDSLLVNYWIQDVDNQIIPIASKRLRPHPAGDIIIDTVAFSTLGMYGLNSIWVEYNPVNPETGVYDQLEQHHFNNIAQKQFFVRTDTENPILDVTFDGVHIMDGDIVSANPEIVIQLKDENEYLLINDTSYFRLFLTDIESGLERRIYFGLSNYDETIEFIPAELPENKCKIYFKPYFHIDGQYQLRVQATDASSNESGDYDYLIAFEVITESTITNVLNYPNPFSTSTRFVFELTGYEIPDNMKIDIFTVTGKLVRTIFMDELGPIRIGRNITEFSWDGTDMYGDRLANGVYFYKITAIMSGMDMDKRETEADKFFKNNIGKMYILR
jgi:hypothetical protein